jgi:aryl-alcohol dehydrogenase-like predicted oxidoreductase
VTTKCFVGQKPASEVPGHIRQLLTESLQRMRIEAVDVLFLHSNIVPDNDPMSDTPDAPTRLTPHQVFAEQVRPTFEALKAEGLIKHWGVTGIGHPDTILQVLGEGPPPAIVQCIANPIDSAGSLTFTPGPRKPREIMAKAQSLGVGVMGIRAVQAGALTDAIDRPLPDDHPEVLDYHRAAAYRTLAKELGMSAADLGHRYAMSMAGVDTVVLGIKNRAELQQCLDAAEKGPLSLEIMARVDASFMPS